MKSHDCSVEDMVRPRLSAEKMADGRLICEVKTARQIYVRVVRSGRVGRKIMTLLEAHETNRHKPAGVEYQCVDRPSIVGGTPQQD